VAGIALTAVAGAAIWWAQDGGASGGKQAAGPSEDQLQAALVTDTTLGSQYTSEPRHDGGLTSAEEDTFGGCSAMDRTLPLIKAHQDPFPAVITFNDANTSSIEESIQYSVA
jgi:hypothetical protein